MSQQLDLSELFIFMQLMNKQYKYIVLIMLFRAILAKFEIGGYYKNFLTIYNPADISVIASDPFGTSSNTVRASLSCTHEDFFSLVFAYSITMEVGKVSNNETIFEIPPILNQTDYRFIDIKNSFYSSNLGSSGSISATQNFDRAYIRLSAKSFDLYLGRQPIALGASRFVSPTDVIMPFLFNALDIEERRGVDAVRLRIPIGKMSEIEAAYILGRNADIDKSAGFLRSKFYFAKTDFALIIIKYREKPLIGFDMMRPIYGAGTWLEAAFTFGNGDEPSDNPQDENTDNSFIRLSAGADYSFNDNTYGSFEYHYNGAGESKPSNYSRNFDKSAYIKGGIYLMAQHYFSIGGTYRFTPLIMSHIQIIANLNDASIILSPSFQYNIAQDIYLAAGAFIGAGKAGKLNGSNFQYNSEFGNFPDMFYASFGVYF